MNQEFYREINKSCDSLKYISAYHDILELALLWCGVSDDKIYELKNECKQEGASGISQGIYTHPYIPCIKVKTQIIAGAIEEGKLMVARDGGREYDATRESIAWHRRRVKGSTFKAFLEEYYQNEKPAFFFDEIERQTNKNITLEAYQTLQAENNSLLTKNKELENRLKKARISYIEQRNAIKQLETENKALKGQISGDDFSSPKSLIGYLKLLKVFKLILLGDTDRKTPFQNDEAIKNHILEKFETAYGLKKSTLDTRFSEINQTELK